MNTDIRIQTTLPRHHKYKKLKRILGESPMEYLVCFWISVAEQEPNGDLVGWLSDDIEDASTWAGEPGAFTNALIDCGFLDILEDGFRPHNWEEQQPWATGAEVRSEKARLAGKASGIARKKRLEKTETSNSNELAVELELNGTGTQDELNGNPRTPSPSPSPSPKSKDKNNNTFNFLKSVISMDVSEQSASDWISVRKKKKAINSATAFARINNTISASSYSWQEAVNICCEKSWGSFDPSWVDDQKDTPKQPKTFAQLEDEYRRDAVSNAQRRVIDVINRRNNNGNSIDGKNGLIVHG